MLEIKIGVIENLAGSPEGKETGEEVGISLQDMITPLPKDGNTLIDTAVKDGNMSDIARVPFKNCCHYISVISAL